MTEELQLTTQLIRGVVGVQNLSILLEGTGEIFKILNLEGNKHLSQGMKPVGFPVVESLLMRMEGLRKTIKISVSSLKTPKSDDQGPQHDDQDSQQSHPPCIKRRHGGRGGVRRSRDSGFCRKQKISMTAAERIKCS